MPEEEGLDWNIAELIVETLWDGKMFSSPQNGYAILGGPPTYPTKWRSHFAGTPISGTFVYLVPLARSRYCASPEASIMRLEAASTLAHKMAAQFWGPPNHSKQH